MRRIMKSIAHNTNTKGKTIIATKETAKCRLNAMEPSEEEMNKVANKHHQTDGYYSFIQGVRWAYAKIKGEKSCGAVELPPKVELAQQIVAWDSSYGGNATGPMELTEREWAVMVARAKRIIKEAGR